jgi:glutamate synthase domain-containing protein 2
MVLILSILIFVLGVYDQLQIKHSLLRNYPIIGHLRFWLEFIRPEIRQYFIESDREKLPFSRNQRALVYQRAKNVTDQKSFGTIDDVYLQNYEWLNQSSKPLEKNQIEELRIRVGNE